MTGALPIPGHVLAVRYALFAVIAVVLNLAAQMATFATVTGEHALYAALIFGSIVGIVAKYVLDKNWIFFDDETRILHRIQQRAQMGDLPFEQLGLPFPLLETLILLLQAIDFFEGGRVKPPALNGAARFNSRYGRYLEQGGGKID